MHFFISYSKLDNRQLASELHHTLNSIDNMSAWMDISLESGSSWAHQIEDEIDRSDYILVLISKDVNRRPTSEKGRSFVLNEIDYAQSQNKKIIPIMTDITKQPLQLAGIQYIDVSDIVETKKIGIIAEQLIKLIESKKIINENSTKRNKRNVNGFIPALSNRKKMLQNLRHFWIDGVLNESLLVSPLVNIDKEIKLDVIDHPWSAFAKSINPKLKFNSETNILDIFFEFGSHLLILGEPGSGKTIMLLQLVRELLDLAEQDMRYPIPVVFNLSTWTPAYESLGQWMQIELHEKYNVPKKIAQEWLEETVILPLLDGLDEVNESYRNICVENINELIPEIGFNGIAVCSRTNDYFNLGVKLRLQGAIILQPLSPEQVEGYLASLDKEVEQIREFLQIDNVLRELASTPLMLNIIVIAYKGLHETKTAKMQSFDVWRRHLFKTYVEHVLDKPSIHEPNYAKTDVVFWLKWIAQNMAKRNQSIFLIEKIERTWLNTINNQYRYDYLVSGTISGIIGLTMGIASIVSSGSVYGSNFGMITGLLSTLAWLLTAWYVVKQDFRDKNIIIIGIAFAAAWGAAGALAFGWLGLLLSGLVGGVSASLAVKLAGKKIQIMNRKTYNNSSNMNSIRTAEILRWSLQESLFGFMIWLMAGLVTGAAIGIAVFSSTSNVNLSLSYSIPFSLVFALTLGLSSGLSSGDVESNVFANQAIWRSLKNAMFVGSWYALVWGLLFGISISISKGIAIGLFIGVLTGIGGGTLGFLLSGGAACFQHLVLRILAYQEKSMPLNYAKFLDYATDKILLRKVGGSYVFIHRYLLEFFADFDVISEKPDAKEFYQNLEE